MLEKVNVVEAFSRFEDAWSPKVAGEVNGVQIRLAKFRGEFIWHHHEFEDELFLVNKGALLLRFRDREVRLDAGEFIIVPRGVEHQPVAETDECEIVAITPRTTLNTGNVENERTVRDLQRI